MITLADIDKLKNKFYLDSEKEGHATRANTIVLTEAQYDALLREMGIDELDDIYIESIEGLQVVFAEGLEEPRLLRL